MGAGLLLFAALWQLVLAEPPTAEIDVSDGCKAASWSEPTAGRLCVLAAPELAGERIEAAAGETLWRQSLVFAHDARLAEDVTVPLAPLRGGAYTFAAFQPLAAVAFDGQTRYCAVRPFRPAMKLWTGGGSFLVCLTDEDGDKKLDHFYSSHDPSFELGVHLLSKGRKERDPLPSPVNVEPAHMAEGPAQALLVRYLGPAKRKGRPVLQFGLALENDAGKPVPIEAAVLDAPLGPDGCTHATLRGAAFMACRSDGKAIAVSLFSAMPEQDFPLQLR